MIDHAFLRLLFGHGMCEFGAFKPDFNITHEARFKVFNNIGQWYIHRLGVST